MDFNTLLGQEFDFYGVDNLNFKLGGTVFQAVEDESDGYRSYLESIEVNTVGGLTFFNQPLARVRVEDSSGDPDNEWSRDFSGWQLTDVNSGHIWLIVGTNNTDDYYPMFTFEYRPDRSQVVNPALAAPTVPELTLSEIAQELRANFDRLMPLYDLGGEIDAVLEALDASIQKIEAKSAH